MASSNSRRRTPELSSFERSSVRIVRRGAFCFLRFALFLLFLSTFDFPPRSVTPSELVSWASRDLTVQAILGGLRDESVFVDRDMPDFELHEPSILPKPELKGSIGEGPNHSNFSDRSSVRILGILSKFRNFR